MEITVKFTDVYDGAEHVRTETFDVPLPTPGDVEDDFYEWAGDHIHPRTGDGNADDRNAGYFAEVLTCALFPSLVNREFTWEG